MAFFNSLNVVTNRWVDVVLIPTLCWPKLFVNRQPGGNPSQWISQRNCCESPPLGSGRPRSARKKKYCGSTLDRPGFDGPISLFMTLRLDTPSECISTSSNRGSALRE